MLRSPRVAIHFCSKCRFTLRASWLAEELLFTFGEQLGEVALLPGSGGVFEVYLGDEKLWDRAKGDGFPEPKQLKQLIRDRIAPDMDLGHSEPKTPAED
ncbi:MAG: SelT/SelW/SelH family protein [Myxococcales bacterium]|nr:SelT/SelW/SelH family protein [Myxococcales bacterium]